MHVKWQGRTVASERAKLAADLASCEAQGGLVARLGYALSEMRRLEAADEHTAQLRRLLCVLASLEHHVEHGGLAPSQVRGGLGLAHKLLLAAGVASPQSRLGFLRAEVLALHSRLQQGQGHNFAAAWLQQIAVQHQETAATAATLPTTLVLADRALRLAQASLARTLYDSVVHHGADRAPAASPTAVIRAHLGLAQLARFRQDYAEAAAQLAAARAQDHQAAPTTSLSDLAQQILWETACQETVAQAKPTPLLALLRRHGARLGGRYHLELSLWLKAVASRAYLDQGTLVRTLARRKDLAVARSGALLTATRTLEDAYDDVRPLAGRLERLGDLLATTSKLPFVEQELLVWASATRFLARERAFGLAALAYGEYAGLSLRLSAGTQNDALGLAADLQDRAWVGAIPDAG